MYSSTTTLLLLILLVSIPFARTIGQNRMADSLRTLIAQAPTPEKKATEMLALSRTLGNTKQHTEERAQLMLEVKTIAREQKSTLLNIMAEIGLANIDYQRKKTDEAETRLNEQLIGAKALKEKYPQASALGILGLIYRSKNEQAKAINAFEQAVSLAENKSYLLMPIHFALGEPYAENAMKHGLLHKTTGDRLLIIRFSLENDTMLRAEIEDNGVGRKKSAEFNAQKINKSHQSFATAATSKRLELLNLGLDTPITSEIIDLYDTQGAATGTKAIIFEPVLGY